MKGNATVTSSQVVDLTVADDLTVTDDLTVSGDTAITGDVTVTGDITTSTASTINDKGACFQSATNRDLVFGY